MEGTNAAKRKNIVIVGGGTAGANAARPLSAQLSRQEYNIIVINPLPFRIWLPGVLRFLVQGCEMKDEVCLGYDKLFIHGNGKFIQGKVTDIEPGNGRKGGDVVLESGKRIPYHILVLSLGSLWEGPPAIPMELEQVAPHVQAYQNQFAKANHVLIVGGGAIGAEIAGEIKDKWPKKKVTIVHASILLLNTAYTDKFRQTVAKGLRDRGVDIILNDWLDYKGTGEVDNIDLRTRFKEPIFGVDYIVHCRGPRPNTEIVAKSLGEKVLTPGGQIHIQPTMQVDGYNDIFAGGDIIDWPEQKQAIKSAVHGKLIAHNIIQKLEGFPMKEYKGQAEVLSLTNGRNRGSTYFGFLTGFVLRDWATRRLKGKDLFISVFKTQMGYT